MQSRRAALVTIAAGTISPLLAQHGGHDLPEVAAAVQLHDPVFFGEADYAMVCRVADLILPRTETPGALDANVPYRIDREVSNNKDLQPVFQQGLAALSAKSADFLSLPEAQQVAILSAMSESDNAVEARFFRTMKDLTIDWYYRSEEGLVKELGFHGNTFRASFPGCTHPEHWPKKAAGAQEQK